MASQRKRTVLITGCSPGGIGHALAMEFHKQGLHVIATARNLDVIGHLSSEGFSTVQLDVTSLDSIAACKKEVEAITDGYLDILVNNAGRSHTIPALDIELDDVRATFEANVFGPMFTIKAFSSLLIKARGLILNISSLSSDQPYLFASAYAATKGALTSFSRVLRMELRPFHVRVMVVMTGTVQSNFASHKERELPNDSLYQPVRHMFLDRLTFSQRNSTTPTNEYATKVVAQALRGEGWLGGWIGGTPDWFYAGGLSGRGRLASWLPRFLVERAAGVIFKIATMSKQLQAAQAKQN